MSASEDALPPLQEQVMGNIKIDRECTMENMYGRLCLVYPDAYNDGMNVVANIDSATAKNIVDMSGQVFGKKFLEN